MIICFNGINPRASELFSKFDRKVRKLKKEKYIECTNFRPKPIESSAREVFIFFRKESGGGASQERRREHGSNRARLETASRLNKKWYTSNSLADDLQLTRGIPMPSAFLY